MQLWPAGHCAEEWQPGTHLFARQPGPYPSQTLPTGQSESAAQPPASTHQPGQQGPQSARSQRWPAAHSESARQPPTQWRAPLQPKESSKAQVSPAAQSALEAQPAGRGTQVPRSQPQPTQNGGGAHA